MDANIVVALIGVGGAILGAFLTAILQPYWTAKIGPKSRLTAVIQLGTFKIPQYLEESIAFYRGLRWDRRANIKPTDDAIEKLQTIRSAGGLAQVTLKNNSKKEIKGIRIAFNDNQDIICDGLYEGSKGTSHFGKVYVIESLPPRSIYHLDIWSYYDISQNRYRDIREIIQITAIEIDQVDVLYEPSDYNKGQYIIISKKYLTISYWVTITSTILFFAITAVYNYYFK